MAGAILLLFYFVAYPPIFGYTLRISYSEGNYQWVDKNLIELVILIVFVFLPTAYFFGADRLLKRWKEEKPNAPVPGPDNGRRSIPNRRRELLRDMISVPFLGAFAYVLYRKEQMG